MTVDLMTSIKQCTINEKPEVEASGGVGLVGPKCDTPILPIPCNFDNRGIVSTERFIKFIPSPKAIALLLGYPNAFLLLSLIAIRARRTEDPLKELEIGEAYIGDHESAGLSRKEYRTALEHLCSQKIILKACVFGKCQKSATKRATSKYNKGTIVKLLNSDIWDINQECEKTSKGHLEGHLGASLGPASPSALIRNKNDKNDKKKIFSSDSVEIGLSQFLFSKICLLIENPKTPNFQKWAAHIDFMIRLDKHTDDEVRNMIEWLYEKGPHFWRKNILSTAKLREQWDRLRIEMTDIEKVKKTQSSFSTSTSPRRKNEIIG